MHPHTRVPTVDVTEIPPTAILLDVREDHEWQAGHIDGAVHIPMYELPNRLNYDAGPITPQAEVVVVCKMGGRSSQVTAWLNQQGFHATNLEGGMLAWATAGRPMIAEGGARPHVG